MVIIFYQQNAYIRQVYQIKPFKEQVKISIEQARIINLLIKDIIINPDGMNINIYKQGMNSLNNEING